MARKSMAAVMAEDEIKRINFRPMKKDARRVRHGVSTFRARVMFSSCIGDN